MKVIDKINGSGLFAQSAYSASTATKDSLGRDITATYLTAVNLPESGVWNDTSNVVSSNSAQWNQGKTYEGISPIVVNNHENKVSADTWVLSAGDGISLTENSANKVTLINCTAQGSGSVSSKYGTITVDGSDIEATNSAIEFKSNGFTSSFEYIHLDEYTDPQSIAWDNYSQGTTLTLTVMNNGDGDTLTYSSNTNVTGLITAPKWTPTNVSLSLPNATAVQFSANHRYTLQSIEVTAASSFQVNELAWKSDLPTYTYNSNNKLSAINGSALVGNEDYLVEQGFVQNLTSPKGTISVLHNKIEGTNSAVKGDVIEGFVSAYGEKFVYPGNSATLTWANYVPNAVLTFNAGPYHPTTLSYSADTGVTGQIVIPESGGLISTLLPTDSTSIVIGDDTSYNRYNFTVSAEDYYEVGELAWKSDVPSYENTEGGLVSAIGSSGLYSTSAGTATYTNKVLDAGTLGGDLTWSSTQNKMVLNPSRTQFGITSGIFKYLSYATGACISYGSYPIPTSNKQSYGGYFKGNEWMISNVSRGAMLAGFNNNGYVYLSGARTTGDDFNLCQYSVSGKNSNGSWKYGNEEDTLLRSLSSQIAYLSGVIDQNHS